MIAGLAPSSSLASASLSLLPPFNLEGSRLVARCALAAQQRQRKQQVQAVEGNSVHLPSLPFPSSSTFVPGFDANESLLNGLPVNQVRYENPHRQGAMFCRSGTWLEIMGANSNIRRVNQEEEEDSYPEAWKGTVRGTRKESSPFSILEFITVAFGLISIRGITSQNYLCMDGRGRLYSAPQSKLTPECVFMEEMLENYYNLYSSCSHGTRKKPWYVALRKTGRVRKGQHTRKKQKSSHFLVIHFNNHTPRTDSTIMGSYGHAATRIHPDFLGYVAENWKNWRSFYSTTNTKDREEKEKKKSLVQQQRQPEARLFSGVSPTSGHLKWGQQSLATTSLQHPHRRHHTPSNNHNESLLVVVDPTAFAAHEKFRKDMRRRRRLEREEKQRQKRKLELESLRLSTTSRRSHPLS